jgi:DNA-binding CsgD family transcriptional regulator
MVGDHASELIKRRILRLCCQGLDSRTLRLEVIVALREAINADAWCIATIDPATLMLTSSIGEGFVMDGSGRFLELEYNEPDFNKFADLARRRPPVARLVPATGGDLHRSARWREICQPVGLRDELRAALVVDDSCWGALDLARSPSSPDFSQEEAAYIADLSAPIALAVRAALVTDHLPVEDTVSGPGLVILSDSMEPEAVSPAAKEWLRQLRALESSWMGPLPNAVYAVATRLRQLEGDDEEVVDLMPRARVQLGSGKWLAVQASRLTTSDGRRQIAVIVESASPAEIAPLIVSAYSLTARESEVAQLVLRGLGTREIATALFISPLTVQQHLKLIFEKVGVRSRRELVSQVFEQQYRPRIKAGAGIGPDGWFSEPVELAALPEGGRPGR